MASRAPSPAASSPLSSAGRTPPPAATTAPVLSRRTSSRQHSRASSRASSLGPTVAAAGSARDITIATSPLKAITSAAIVARTSSRRGSTSARSSPGVADPLAESSSLARVESKKGWVAPTAQDASATLDTVPVATLELSNILAVEVETEETSVAGVNLPQESAPVEDAPLGSLAAVGTDDVDMQEVSVDVVQEAQVAVEVEPIPDVSPPRQEADIVGGVDDAESVPVAAAPPSVTDTVSVPVVVQAAIPQEEATLKESALVPINAGA